MFTCLDPSVTCTHKHYNEVLLIESQASSGTKTPKALQLSDSCTLEHDTSTMQMQMQMSTLEKKRMASLLLLVYSLK